VRPRDVDALLDVYGMADQPHRAWFIKMAREARQKGWWEAWGDVFPSSLSTFVGLEAEASEINQYQLALVPSLLQTREYATAVNRGGVSADTLAQSEQWVEIRMRRQEILHRPDGPRLSAVIDEGVIRRPIGGEEVMTAQLERLLDVARDRTTLQVLPFSHSVHTPPVDTFTLLNFPEETYHPVVYTEHLNWGFYIEEKKDVERYGRAFENLRRAALDPDDSIAFLRSIRRGL
jgi:hypothetical protein